ncbi:unnamed protein product, partial [Closterium sp. NIES-54]
PTADPVGAGFRYEDPGGASSRGAGVGAESVSVRGPGSGGAGVGAEPMTAGDSSLRGAGVSGAVPGGATTGAVLGLPPLRTLLPPTPTPTSTRPVFAVPVRSSWSWSKRRESWSGSSWRYSGWRRSSSSSSSRSRSSRSSRSSSSCRSWRSSGRSRSRSSSSSHLLLLSLVFGPSVSPLLLLPPPPLLPSLVLRFLLLTPPQLFSLLLCPRCPLLFLTLGLRITLLVLVLRPLFPSLTFILFCSSQPRLSPSVIPSPESALTASLSIRVTDYYRTYCPVLSRVLASLVTDPRASLSSVSALTAAVTEFASTRCLDYATSLVAAPPTNPLDVGGESALGCDALEDRQFELEFLTAASPHLNAMLLAPEGDPDALDIPTPCTYAEAQVLLRFELQHSTVQRTPLAIDHRLTGPFPDEPFEPSGPYAELVGCLVQDIVLIGQYDSSYADDAKTHGSTQGYCFSLGSGAVLWRSTCSSSVSTSTTKAEIYAGAMAAQELRWLTFLLTDLGERPSSAPTLFTDNKATILLSREPRLESKVKLINV